MKYIFHLILFFLNLGFIRAILDIPNNINNTSKIPGSNSDTNTTNNANRPSPETINTNKSYSTINSSIPNYKNINYINNNNNTEIIVDSNIVTNENKKNITLNGISYIYSVKGDAFKTMIDEFNKTNNLGIYLEVEFYYSNNSTAIYENFGSQLEATFNNKNNRKKYDIIFYFDTNTPVLGRHFVNLEEYIEPSHINMFEKSLIEKSCTYNKTIVGLPVFFDTNILYSNKKLLHDYGRSVPKTWDQLIDTAIYIRDKEKEKGHTDLDPFLGHFSANYDGGFSMYEVTSSFRKSNEDPFPDETTDIFKEGVQTLKKIREKLYSSNELFESDMTYALERFRAKKVLFMKFYMGSVETDYESSVIPGKKEGVTGTIPGVFSVSLNRYTINDEAKRNAALHVIKHITSKEIQKKHIIINGHSLSAITDLYHDPDVCQAINCDVFLQSRPFTKLSVRYPESGMDKFRYVDQVRSYAFDYIYGKTTLDKAIQNIKDLTQIYNLSINKNESVLGFVLFVFYIVFISIMIIAVEVVCIISRKTQYKYFLSDDFWIISILGTIVMMSSMLCMYGSLTPEKCQGRIALASIGFSMTLLPILNKLIVNFPTHNKISLWFDKVRNKYIFFIGSMIIIGFVNSLLFINHSFSLNHIDGSNGQKFQSCTVATGFGKFVIGLLILIKCIILLSILLLVFIEWSYKESLVEMKVISALVFVEVLAIILLITYSAFNLKMFIIYTLIFCSFALFFSLSNFVCIYILKLIPLFKKEGEVTLHDVVNRLHKYRGFYPSSITESRPVSFVASGIVPQTHNYTNVNIVTSTTDHPDNNRSQENELTLRNEEKEEKDEGNKSQNNELLSCSVNYDNHNNHSQNNELPPSIVDNDDSHHQSQSGNEDNQSQNNEIPSRVGSYRTHNSEFFLGIPNYGMNRSQNRELQNILYSFDSFSKIQSDFENDFINQTGNSYINQWNLRKNSLSSNTGSRSNLEKSMDTLIRYHYKESKD